jgi:hypothetical protein
VETNNEKHSKNPKQDHQKLKHLLKQQHQKRVNLKMVLSYGSNRIGSDVKNSSGKFKKTALCGK